MAAAIPTSPVDILKQTNLFVATIIYGINVVPYCTARNNLVENDREKSAENKEWENVHKDNTFDQMKKRNIYSVKEGYIYCQITNSA